VKSIEAGREASPRLFPLLLKTNIVPDIVEDEVTQFEDLSSTSKSLNQFPCPKNWSTKPTHNALIVIPRSELSQRINTVGDESKESVLEQL
jgi:hypothetical protein